MAAMRHSHYYQGGGTHPYEHTLKLQSSIHPMYLRGFSPERSLTVTNLQINPRTTFEMDRPQTHNSPRVVVINTSFRSALNDNPTPRKRIPTFPELATENASKRKSCISRLTHSSKASAMTVRKASGHSTYRRDTADVTGVLGEGIFMREQTTSPVKRSDLRGLTQRQSNTFAAYAKYNDIVNATRARERAVDSLITSNVNNLTSLTSKKRPVTNAHALLSNEKHVWISAWVASTSAALSLEQNASEESDVSKTLSVIDEH